MDPAAVVVFDIDGVVADVHHRLHYLQSRPKNWGAFFGSMAEDVPLPEGVRRVAEAMDAGSEVRYLTGRPERYRSVTEEWIEAHAHPAPLTMRPNSDRRPARVWKASVLVGWRRSGAMIDRVVDDDPQVVSELRALGFTVVHAQWATTLDTTPTGEVQAVLWEAQETDGAS